MLQSTRLPVIMKVDLAEVYIQYLGWDPGIILLYVDVDVDVHIYNSLRRAQADSRSPPWCVPPRPEMAPSWKPKTNIWSLRVVGLGFVLTYYTTPCRVSRPYSLSCPNATIPQYCTTPSVS
jgi:hypothetical protein